MKMKCSNILTRDWLYEQYITLNKSVPDISKEIKISTASLYRALKKFKIEKDDIARETDSKNKRIKTNISKYGFENPGSNADVKNKIIQTNLTKYGVESQFQRNDIKEKIVQSNNEKYGCDSPLQSEEIRELCRATLKDKYGVDHPLQNSELLKRQQDTMLERHGVPSAMKNSHFKEKAMETNIARYGVPHAMQNVEIAKTALAPKIGNNTIKEYFGYSIKQLSDMYDIPYSTATFLLRNSDLKFKCIEDISSLFKKSKALFTAPERKIADLLGIQKYGKMFDLDKYPDLRYKPDFKISDLIAINVDGLYWHSDANNVDKNYHFNMRKQYENYGLRILQFREDEVRDRIDIIHSMINNAMGKSNKLYARKCSIHIDDNIDDVKVFFSSSHLMGWKPCKTLTLKFNNEIQMAIGYKMVGSKLKIERMASKLNTLVVGGFSKMMKYLETYCNPKLIEYWVDLRYGTGKFLTNHEFSLSHETLGWKWTDGFRTFNRLTYRANMDNRKLSQAEYAAEAGVYKIYDAGQRLYIKNIE